MIRHVAAQDKPTDTDSAKGVKVAADTPDLPPGKRWALLIGVDKYDCLTTRSSRLADPHAKRAGRSAAIAERMHAAIDETRRAVSAAS